MHTYLYHLTLIVTFFHMKSNQHINKLKSNQHINKLKSSQHINKLKSKPAFTAAFNNTYMLFWSM